MNLFTWILGIALTCIAGLHAYLGDYFMAYCNLCLIFCFLKLTKLTAYVFFELLPIEEMDTKQHKLKYTLWSCFLVLVWPFTWWRLSKYQIPEDYQKFLEEEDK